MVNTNWFKLFYHNSKVDFMCLVPLTFFLLVFFFIVFCLVDLLLPKGRVLIKKHILRRICFLVKTLPLGNRRSTKQETIKKKLILHTPTPQKKQNNLDSWINFSPRTTRAVLASGPARKNAAGNVVPFSCVGGKWGYAGPGNGPRTLTVVSVTGCLVFENIQFECWFLSD